jgi:mRNA-degrading endonuclease HigB of HigAB toxin-antitoxin module
LEDADPIEGIADPDPIVAAFAYASIVNDQRVVLNTRGNDHRLVAAIHPDKQGLLVRGVFTYRQYDGIGVAVPQGRLLDISLDVLLRERQ